MTTSLFARKAVLFWALATAVSASLQAQTDLPAGSPTGGEYAPAGALKGDQVHPSVCLTPSGGWLVYEDSVIDNGGFGIAAVGLDSDLSPVSSPFRVNKRTAGDQLRPKVAILAGGGAVFVWQSGTLGNEHIYARFLSPTNTWLTQDVAVNSFTTSFQTEPAVAALGNGNVVVVWNSFEQAGSSSELDVYGQVFAPDGAKIGSEFLVNQYTPFNQRNPVVVPLSSGGFAVAWISEQQQRLMPAAGTFVDGARQAGPSNLPFPSVDVYARCFDANASYAADEFLVNTDNSLCANPHLAATTDGGFVALWSQKNRTSLQASWDVFSRVMSSGGTGGPARMVNSYAYGDQFAPEISGVGTNFFVVWDSLGQDGDRDGVYGQFLAADGTPVGGEIRVNTGTKGRQIHPAVAGESSGRFLAVWSGYVIGGRNLDLYGQRYSMPWYVPIQPAEIAQYFNQPVDSSAGNPLGIDSESLPGTSGAIIAGLPFYPGTGAGSAGVSNSLSSASGTYHGLFYDTNRVTVGNSGYFVATVNAVGRYTAKCVQGGRTAVFTGLFDASGMATNRVRLGGFDLAVSLQLDLAGSEQIRGQISGVFAAVIIADRQPVEKSSFRAVAPGRYTLVIPADGFSAGSPQGVGFGSVRVDSQGNVFFAGALADGSALSQSGAMSKQGTWPLYCSLYGGKGAVLAWLQFTQVDETEAGGRMLWTKPGGLVTTRYKGGFTNNVVAKLSTYVPPASAQPRVLGFSAGEAIFYGGGLTNTFTNTFNLGPRNQVTLSGKLHMAFNLTSGLFNGNTVNPGTGKVFTFRGALFQQEDLGVGFFLGPKAGGGFYLRPQ